MAKFYNSSSDTDDDVDKYHNPPAFPGTRPKSVITLKQEDDGGFSTLLENILRHVHILDDVGPEEMKKLEYFHINTSSEEGDVSESTDEEDEVTIAGTSIKKEPVESTEEDISSKPSCSKDLSLRNVSPDRIERLLFISKECEESSAKIKSEERAKYDERSQSKNCNRSSEDEKSRSKRCGKNIEERRKKIRSHSKKRHHKVKQEYLDDSDSDGNYSSRSRKTERRRSTSPERKHARHKVKQEYLDDSDGNYSTRSIKTERRRSTSPERKHARSPSPKRQRWHHSSSPSPERPSHKYSREEREPSEPPPTHLFGSYHCELCKVTMTSQVTFDSHMAGKRHFKALKLKNFNDISSASTPNISTSEGQSKYPQPPPNAQRVRVNEEARLQQLIKRKVKSPCPGLHNVIEIQGIQETHYYCKLCDSPCSINSIVPHLNGFKHMLRCLEFYRPEVYNRLKFKQKYEVENEIIDRLRAIEDVEGIGKMAVEKEILVGDDMKYYERKSIKIEMDSRMVSSSGDKDFTALYKESCIPDTSKGGFTCTVCEAHTNSIEMWESHIKGKRHLTNVRKRPLGSAPSKLKAIPVPNAKSILEEMLRDVDEPIVGLKCIRETQNHLTNTRIYQCNICGACVTDGDIIEHLLSQKHRIRYLEEVRHPDLLVLDNMSLLDHSALAVVEDICTKIEHDEGRGHPSVFIVKNNCM